MWFKVPVERGRTALYRQKRRDVIKNAPLLPTGSALHIAVWNSRKAVPQRLVATAMICGVAFCGWSISEQ